MAVPIQSNRHERYHYKPQLTRVSPTSHAYVVVNLWCTLADSDEQKSDRIAQTHNICNAGTAHLIIYLSIYLTISNLARSGYYDLRQYLSWTSNTKKQQPPKDIRTHQINPQKGQENSYFCISVMVHQRA